MPDGNIAIGIDKSTSILIYSEDGDKVREIHTPFNDLETFWWIKKPKNP